MAAQLGAEELRFNRRDEEALLDLAYELCPDLQSNNEAQWRSNLWGGAVAVLLGAEPFEADAEYSRWGIKFLETVKQRLEQLIQKSPLSPLERAEAGRHLAKLGDPRFREDAWWLPDEPLLGFVEIPAGPFQMGESGEGRSIEIPYAYYISRYPITQAQFQSFVDDGGYQEESFWPEAKSAGVWAAGTVQRRLDNQPRQQPEKFGDPFGLSNHPVVGVTWYEALAYCRWLTKKLRQWERTPEPLRTILQTGGEAGKPWSIMLPNEPEWEKAARGMNDDRLYPWGKVADPTRANYRETNINATSAVGYFPQGKSPYQVEEMSGNVWEWTRSLYEEEPYPKDRKAWAIREDLIAEADHRRVLRGGSWYNVDYGMHCANRYGDFTDFRSRSFGFRVAASPFSSR
ncbi:MAG: formylglycine-generating enzyme family protein [Nitrospirales bacterium]